MFIVEALVFIFMVTHPNLAHVRKWIWATGMVFGYVQDDESSPGLESSLSLTLHSEEAGLQEDALPSSSINQSTSPEQGW